MTEYPKPLATSFPTLEQLYGKEELAKMAEIAGLLVEANQKMIEEIDRIGGRKK